MYQLSTPKMYIKTPNSTTKTRTKATTDFPTTLLS